MGPLIPIIITGPTAGGKSTFAEELCDVLEGQIINADSLQIYKGLPKLTAQPDIQKDRHVLYSTLEPDDKCDVVRWVGLAKEAITLAQEKGRRPLIVGGTGFYLKVLLEGIASIPNIPAHIIQKAEYIMKTEGVEYLYKDLKEKDPKLPEHIKPNDPHRLIRAWTVLEATGISIRKWQQQEQVSSSEAYIKVLCTHNRNILYERINQRFASMWGNGIISEVQVFNSTYQHIKHNYAAKSIGFTEVNAYIKGRLSEAEAIEQAQTKTRQYAKRQLTWFRHQFKSDVVLEGPQFNMDKVLMFCHKSETQKL